MKIHVLLFTLFATALSASAEVTVLKNGSDLDGNSFYGSFSRGSNGLIYGVGGAGGAYNGGTFFVFNENGGDFNATYDFKKATGYIPVSAPIQASDKKFYGTTYSGGASDDGVIYVINSNGTEYTVLHDFTAATDGERPYPQLIEGADGKLYGTTSDGGANGVGTIFRIRKDGSGFGVLRSLTAATDGDTIFAGLVQGPDGVLYGAAAGGGANGGGTVFSINPDGTNFTVIKAFTPATDGSTLAGTLYLSSDGFLYGTAATGGSKNGGTVFRIRPNGSGFSKLHEFSDSAPENVNGYVPYGGVVEGVDGKLYGTCAIDSTNFGTVYSVSKSGQFTLLHSFTGTTGSGPGRTPYYESLLQAKPGVFIGGTYLGGALNLGVIFKLTVPVPKPTIVVKVKPPSTTKLAKFTFKGTASGPGEIKSVEYQVGNGKFIPAKGKANWSFTAALKKGKNTFGVRAVDSLGQKSAVKKIVVTRK